MALSVATIDRFINPGTPLARAGGARMLLRATGGNLYGAAMLAAIARKESEFGTTGRLPAGHNYYGYGIHEDASVNAAPTPLAMATRVWKALIKPTGYYKDAKTAREAISVYAPSFENNTAQYQSQADEWLAQMGANPNANFRTGARVPVPAGGGGGGAGSSAGGAAAAGQPGGIVLSPRAAAAISKYLSSSRVAVTRGVAPRGVGNVSALIDASPNLAGAAPPAVVGGARRRGAGDDGGAATLSAGGEWGGTVAPVTSLTALAEKFGLSVTSRKRTSPSPVAGTRSDHYVGNKNAYAHDIGWGGSRPTPDSDRAASAIVNALSGGKERSWGTHGGVYENTINGIRFQVIYRSNVGGNHWNHIHLGARRVG